MKIQTELLISHPGSPEQVCARFCPWLFFIALDALVLGTHNHVGENISLNELESPLGYCCWFQSNYISWLIHPELLPKATSPGNPWELCSPHEGQLEAKGCFRDTKVGPLFQNGTAFGVTHPPEHLMGKARGRPQLKPHLHIDSSTSYPNSLNPL